MTKHGGEQCGGRFKTCHVCASTKRVSVRLRHAHIAPWRSFTSDCEIPISQLNTLEIFHLQFVQDMKHLVSEREYQHPPLRT